MWDLSSWSCHLAGRACFSWCFPSVGTLGVFPKDLSLSRAEWSLAEALSSQSGEKNQVFPQLYFNPAGLKGLDFFFFFGYKIGTSV